MVAVDIVRELREIIDGDVFFDLGSIDIGKQFNEEIATALRRSSVIVVLLGRGWAGAVDGTRRIDDDRDVFRREIEAELASGAAVIPVLAAFDPADGPNRDSAGAVVLLSGDPPTNLADYLRPLERREFVVQEIGMRVQAGNPVSVVLSTSDVRSVERWIRQRAVVCYLRPPTRESLKELAQRRTGMDEHTISRVIDEALAMQEAAGRENPVLDPRGILDTLRAVKALGIDVTDTNRDWRALLDALMPT